jgi:hypothetical protein
MSRRDEEKKQRRLKRLKKRQQSRAQLDSALDGPGGARLGSLIRNLQRLTNLPMPATWPGASDPTLARPDLVKLEFGEWVTRTAPARGQLKQLEDGFQKGLLGFLPDMEHWAMEEFFWHSYPGEAWHPLDAFLASASDRFPPWAQEQLRRWKEAQCGIFEVGEVKDDLVQLREWDPFTGVPSGPWWRAIALNIGGVNYYRELQGQLNLTYLAPWAPQQQLFCAMGYGSAVPVREANRFLPYVGLRHPDKICGPMPWKTSARALDEHMRQWRTREWHGWLQERLRFPFAALINLRPNSLELKTVVSLLPSTPQQARSVGIYFEVPLDNEVAVVGATGVTPLDVTAPNLAALREYGAYREQVGPPPAVRGQPSYLEIQ